MSGVGQVLATGGTTIVGVAVGAGLTYWLGALNRRHQEAREDKTRWYEERRRVYVAMVNSSDRMEDALRSFRKEREREEYTDETYNQVDNGLDSLRDVAMEIHLVGSDEAYRAAAHLFESLKNYFDSIIADVTSDEHSAICRKARTAFLRIARIDLGYPGKATPRAN